MKHFSFRSLRARLVLLILLSFTPMVVLTFYTNIEEQRETAEEVKASVLRLVRLAAEEQRRIVEGAHQLLTGLAQLPEVRNPGAEACSKVFAGLRKKYPHYEDMGAADTQGNVFCSTHPLAFPIAVADRAWFKRAVETRRFSVGEYLISRISGSPGVVFALPSTDEADVVRAVVFVILDLEWFNELVAKANLPQGAALTVRDRSGTILARYPDPEQWVGRNVPEAPIVREISRRNAHGAAESVGVDGVHRLYAFTPIGDKERVDFVLSMGVPVDVAYAGANRILYRNMAALGMAAVLSLGAAWLGSGLFLVRKVEKLLGTAKKLAGGDFRARTGLSGEGGELSLLARAFDEMAQALEERECAMQKSEASYRTLAENLPGMVYRVHLQEDHRMQYFNDMIRPLTGFLPEELECGEVCSIEPHILPEDREYVVQAVKQAILENSPFRVEYRFRRRDGQVRYFSERGRPVYDSGHRPMYVDGVIFDVTERKESEERYRHLVENARDIIFAVSSDAVFTTLNPAFEAITGWPCSRWIGQPFPPLIHPDDRLFALEVFQRALNGENIPLFELRIQAQSGMIWMDTEFIIGPRIREGAVAGVTGIARDVTERNRMTEERNRLATVIEHATEGVLVTTTGWSIQYVNPAFERISGYGQEELLGRHARILSGGKPDLTFYRAIRDTLRRGEAWTGRITSKRKDGAPYQVDATISPIRDKSAEISHYAVIERDVTREVRLEKQIRQAQKMEAIGTLAGGIAHDFNNILSAILGYSELAMDKIAKDSPVQKDLDQVLRAGNRARDLVKQILTFSRQNEQERRPIRVAPIVKEALKLLRASLPSTIELRDRLSVSDGGDTILADPTQIHQILMNLCTNAAHAMRDKGGVLEVALAGADLEADFVGTHPHLLPGRHLHLLVSDTGTGMRPEIAERIFEPFFTTKSPGEGTGMGLSVVHGIVESHNGIITVYSEPGKGTTFHVFLPVVTKEGEAPRNRLADTPLQGGSERILFVDDEETIVQMMQEWLHRLGYDVLAKKCSLEALEAFRKQSGSFDLVITDQTMPHLTGIDLVKELRRIRPGIPIILCTGFSEGTTEEKASTMGIQELLMKPIIFRDLAESIRRALGSRSHK